MPELVPFCRFRIWCRASDEGGRTIEGFRYFRPPKGWRWRSWRKLFAAAPRFPPRCPAPSSGGGLAGGRSLRGLASERSYSAVFRHEVSAMRRAAFLFCAALALLAPGGAAGQETVQEWTPRGEEFDPLGRPQIFMFVKKAETLRGTLEAWAVVFCGFPLEPTLQLYVDTKGEAPSAMGAARIDGGEIEAISWGAARIPPHPFGDLGRLAGITSWRWEGRDITHNDPQGVFYRLANARDIVFSHEPRRGEKPRFFRLLLGDLSKMSAKCKKRRRVPASP